MRSFSVLAAVVMVGVVAGAPLAYKVRKHTEYRNLRVVEPGRLYRSGQLTEAALGRTCREKGIRTVVSLREKADDGAKAIDSFEQPFCLGHGIEYRRLDVPDWEAHDGAIPAEKTLDAFCALVNDANIPKPMLLHCFAGEHRTGALVAVYRMEYDGWANADAVAEMTSMGNARTTFSDTLVNYLMGYKPCRAVLGPAAPGR